ncbi:hypothetical protein E2493_10375 [Sphingomonas parva]|uniref:ATPase n=1 Tax=Sphingomonas parva TaxID=2555898 RepID=A0A4Y8ZQS4_9SPHN|nr:SRPBCC family protein [Sphingomonas parva]TFI58380.1 hypothetical protein E2493_10375 [Sphingomonas parva]
MKYAAAALMLAIAGTAQAEVVSSAPGGFEVRSVKVVKGTPEQVWTTIAKIGDWWDPAHSYSGKAANLSLSLETGACFCEAIPAGTQAGNGGATAAAGMVIHGRVLMAMPYQTVTLDSALGPILDEGATGRLKWTLKPVAGGTEVTQSYVVGGYIRGGGDKLAPIVDMVLGQALTRLQAHLAR